MGRNAWEEVSFEPSGSPAGEAFGWDILEATYCFEASPGCDRGGTALPVAEYGHDLGGSVTGGYVYRGETYPALRGIYFFAHYCSGRIWGLRQADSGVWQMAQLPRPKVRVASFGEDAAGQLHILDVRGKAYRPGGLE